jgi:SAM-dependent methyltransferase
LFAGGISSLACASFDVAISLFNVVNCIPDRIGIENLFDEVARSLRKGGIFVFECWNPVEVLRTPPTVVQRLYEYDNTRLIRTATPVVDYRNEVVFIDYNIIVESTGPKQSHDFRHSIYLHRASTFESCLSAVGLNNINWYSDISSGMKPSRDDDRLILCSAVKS